MDGFATGYNQGIQSAISKRNAKTFETQTKQQGERAQKQDYLKRAKDMSAAIAELKKMSKTPQQLEAVNAQAKIARDALLEEGRRLGLESQTDLMLKNALMTPTLMEQAQMAGEVSATEQNAFNKSFDTSLLPADTNSVAPKADKARAVQPITPEITEGDLTPLNEDQVESLIQGEAMNASGAVSGASEAKEIRQAVSTAADVFNIVNTQRLNFESTPAAAGIAGYLNENMGGLLQQIASSPIPVANTIAQGIDENLSKVGIDQEEIQRVRTEAQAAVARLIPLMTGDTSGRFTDKEQEITRLATKVREPKASVGQIIGAMTALENISMQAFIPEIGTFLDSQGVNLNNDQGQMVAIQTLKNFGVTDEQAIELIAQVIERRQ